MLVYQGLLQSSFSVLLSNSRWKWKLCSSLCSWLHHLELLSPWLGIATASPFNNNFSNSVDFGSITPAIKVYERNLPETGCKLKRYWTRGKIWLYLGHCGTIPDQEEGLPFCEVATDSLFHEPDCKQRTLDWNVSVLRPHIISSPSPSSDNKYTLWLKLNRHLLVIHQSTKAFWKKEVCDVFHILRMHWPYFGHVLREDYEGLLQRGNPHCHHPNSSGLYFLHVCDLSFIIDSSLQSERVTRCLVAPHLIWKLWTKWIPKEKYAGSM